MVSSSLLTRTHSVVPQLLWTHSSTYQRRIPIQLSSFTVSNFIYFLLSFNQSQQVFEHIIYTDKHAISNLHGGHFCQLPACAVPKVTGSHSFPSAKHTPLLSIHSPSHHDLVSNKSKGNHSQSWTTGIIRIISTTYAYQNNWQVFTGQI